MKQQVGSYEVLRVLARGGMAVVYLARQPTLDRDIALKRLQLESDDPTLVQRFVREAQLAAGLDHPNVVTLFDFFEDDGVAYIAMEYVRGGTLRTLVGRLELPQVFGVLEGVLAGLAHAEARGIAHRDLKPENVLITRGGGVKIADFGIARAYNALTPSLTGPGAAIGTPSYMAPEQVLDEPLGPYTDIYAVGVIAYELLASRPPFESDGSPLAVLYCHVHKPPPALAELAPDVPPPVCDWVHWLLAKPPADRPASAAAAWHALEEIAVTDLGPYWRRQAAITPGSTQVPTPVLARDGGRTPPRTPTTKVSRRLRLPKLRVVAGLAALGVAGAAAYVAFGSDGEPREAPPAAQAAKPPRNVDTTPYDFDGDGRAELVLGMADSGADRAGVVLVRRRGRDQVIRPADAGIEGPYDSGVNFGRSVASGDFDGDGHVDLAASAPGRELVAVIGGTEQGLEGGPVDIVRAGGVRIEGAYGSRMLAADMNRDNYDDLVVGAPGADPGPVGSGFVQVVFGGPQGLGDDRKNVLRFEESLVNFGTALRVGDINRDGHLDLVEGTPDDRITGRPGHASYCRGTRDGPGRCTQLVGPASSGTSGLAVADVNGDRYDDIVQGDAVKETFEGAVGGEVRLWLGGRGGPASEPITIDQNTTGLQTDDEEGDQFGFSVGAADLDRDGKADIVVGAPGEDLDVPDMGAITVIRGGASGRARTGHTGFARTVGIRGTPLVSEAFGANLVVMDIAGTPRPEVIVKAGGAVRVEDSLYVLEATRSGLFAPGEVRDWRPLREGLDMETVDIDEIRIGRGDA